MYCNFVLAYMCFCFSFYSKKRSPSPTTKTNQYTPSNIICMVNFEWRFKLRTVPINPAIIQSGELSHIIENNIKNTFVDELGASNRNAANGAKSKLNGTKPA